VGGAGENRLPTFLESHLISLLLAAWALWVFPLARFVGGLVTGFVQADYGPSTGSGVAWLLGLLSALVVGVVAGPSTTSSGLAVHKTPGRWVKW